MEHFQFSLKQNVQLSFEIGESKQTASPSGFSPPIGAAVFRYSAVPPGSGIIGKMEWTEQITGEE